MKIRKNVLQTQTKNCTFCLQIGTISIYFGKGKKDYCGAYLRLFTPDYMFKFTRPSPSYTENI